jgi:hypothetical protein
MVARSLARSLAPLGLILALAACSGTATPPPAGGGSASLAGAATAAPATAGPATAASAGSTGAGGGNGFEGSFKTSGLYSATWTVAKDMEPNPFNSVNNPTLTSDKGTFGNIAVKPDGSLSFGSAAPGLSGAYTGTGAKVTLDTTGQFVCAFTVDTDLTGSNDKAILHMSGGMTVHWSLGVGEQNCP